MKPFVLGLSLFCLYALAPLEASAQFVRPKLIREFSTAICAGSPVASAFEQDVLFAAPSAVFSSSKFEANAPREFRFTRVAFLNRKHVLVTGLSPPQWS